MSAHALALAFDEYLQLTDPHHEARRQIEAYLSEPSEPGMPPQLSMLKRLRWEAEQEVERLIALMDALDGDADLEISAEVDGNFADDGNGWEPNFATTAAEDSNGEYAQPPVPYVIGLDQAPDELEVACEDEGAQCEDEGAWDELELTNEDGDMLDQQEGDPQDGPYHHGPRQMFRERARERFRVAHAIA